MPFSQDTLDFLFINRMEDSRKWFEEHNAEYRIHVLEPLRELVQELTPHMLQIDSQFVTEPKVDKTICRIWRDTRYSHDPSLYRDTMWIIFKRDRMHTTEYPGIYFEITCTGFNYGCGFYHASTSYMHLLRKAVLENSDAFQKAQHAFMNQDIYHMLGECYKRPHYPDQPEEIQQWVERRNIGFTAESEDMELLFSPALADKLSEDLEKLSPIYQFLLEVALLELQNSRNKNERL